MARRKKSPAPYRATATKLDSPELIDQAINDATAGLEAAIRSLCQRFAEKALRDALSTVIPDGK